MMTDTFVPLLTLLLAFYLWQAALKSRELARSLGQALCERTGVQLLDQTVALQRIGIRRSGSGLPRLFRRYRFEISTDGTDRHYGTLDISAERIVAYSLPMEDSANQASTMAGTSAPPQLH